MTQSLAWALVFLQIWPQKLSEKTQNIHAGLHQTKKSSAKDVDDWQQQQISTWGLTVNVSKSKPDMKLVPKHTQSQTQQQENSSF